MLPLRILSIACILMSVFFLYKESYIFLKDQIMRKKSVIAMDSRYTTMIENAYYQINPPEFSPASTKPPRPPIKEFLRKLIYTDLSKVTSRRIIKLLRRWNWEEKQMASYGIKVLSSAHRIKYMNIKILAGVVAELFSYQVGHPFLFI